MAAPDHRRSQDKAHGTTTTSAKIYNGKGAMTNNNSSKAMDTASNKIMVAMCNNSNMAAICNNNQQDISKIGIATHDG